MSMHDIEHSKSNIMAIYTQYNIIGKIKAQHAGT